MGDGGWWWLWIGWWWAANTAPGGPPDGQARPMVTLERTMAAAARQGRDSCCQSARRSPEGGVKNGRLGAFWVWLQMSEGAPQSIDKVYIFVEPTTFVVRLSQGFAGHEALHRDPGTCGPRSAESRRSATSTQRPSFATFPMRAGTGPPRTARVSGPQTVREIWWPVIQGKVAIQG